MSSLASPTTCGCPVNATEADPTLYPCPCGDHCTECQGAQMTITMREVHERIAVSNYTVGETVEVHSFGRWYRGTIVKLGRSRITVDYKAGRGAQRIKAFDLCRVRKLGTV